MRDWSDLLIGVDAAREPSTVDDGGSGGEKGGRWFKRLRDNLARSRKAMTQQIVSVASFDPNDAGVWERIEEGLVAADVGVNSTVQIVERLEAEASGGRLSTGTELIASMRSITSELLEKAVEGRDTIDVSHTPTVIVMVGVNGTGKTTTIGKLASRLSQFDKRVVIAAADTFRAAAIEQLDVWAQRAGAHMIKTKHGGDPASVAYDAVDYAAQGNADVVLIDTAGRLHTKANLMQELEKISRVISKRLPGAPHETLLTIDATTGQNGMRQAVEFADIANVSGVVLTKLDGSAKGGIAVAICNELQLPIKLVGIGEQLDDLRPFDPGDFAAALFPDELLVEA